MRYLLALTLLLCSCTATQLDGIDKILEALEEESTDPSEVPSVPAPQPTPTPELPSLPQPEVDDEKKPVVVRPEKPGRDCRGEPYNCCFTANPDRTRPLEWDGRSGGFLWKPGSDHHSGGVFLLAGWYGRARSVELCCSKGCQSLQDGDGGNADPEGCRHHWRISMSPKQIKRKLGEGCYFVPDGRVEDLKVSNIANRKE